MVIPDRDTFLSFLPFLLLGFFIGVYTLISCSLTTTWTVLLSAGLLVAFAMLFYENWLRFSVFCIFLFLPLGLSKELVNLEAYNVYVPSLRIQLSDLFIIGALLLWGWRILTKKQKLPRWYQCHTLALIVIAWSALTIFNASVVALGFCVWAALFKSFLFYLFISDYFDGEEIARTVLYALFFSVVLQLIVACGQQIMQNPLFIQGMKGQKMTFGLRGFEIFRPSGTLEHPNELSSFLLFSQPIIFSAAYFYLRGVKRVLFFLVFLLSIIIHVWTYSRIGWFSIACEGMIFIFLLIRKHRLSGSNLMSLLCCFVIICCILGVYHARIAERLFGFDNMSTKSRKVMERISIQIIVENPICGIGCGNYPQETNNVWPDNYHLIGKEAVKLIAGRHYVHNGYLLMLAETGLIGLLLWCVFFGRILLRGYRNIVESEDDFHLSWSVGVFLALIGLLINMTLEHFRYNMLTLIMWTCAAIILALSQWNRRDKKIA